ncbi:MAG TPA: FtsQ-type POTRA domain-containing protein [Anaerolineae bacterium]|nr:FtsQ-type POTRA domain-containing protein [Anaerolineae bacterium]
MFKKRPKRRSELRLGTQAINYETTSIRPNLSLTPAVQFWQDRGVKLSGLVILTGLISALYVLFTSSAFFVYGAEIRGNVAVSAREIYNVAGIDSQSVFWIRPAEITQRIQAIPNIKSASVAVRLPARVLIQVEERRPQLLWKTGDTVWWIDEEGTVVPPKANMEDMLTIIDDDRQPLEAGYQIDQTIIKGAQTLRVLAPDVRNIRHTRRYGLIVATPEGWPVFLGDGSDMKAKLVSLSALLPSLHEEEREPGYIDLRDPLRPVYRLKPEIEVQVPVRPQLRPAVPPNLQPPNIRPVFPPPPPAPGQPRLSRP